jgi:Hemerythrin HHE cation binding domain
MTPAPLADARDMFAVHTMFRRESGAMPGLVRAVPAGDEQRVTVVADHITVISRLLAMHHSEEDEHIWPRLHERVATETVPIISVMEEQHEGIRKGHLRVNQALEAWRATGSAETRDTLAESIEELLPLLGENLALEIPPELLPAIFGMIMYEGDPDVIDTPVTRCPAGSSRSSRTPPPPRTPRTPRNGPPPRPA